MASTPWRLCTCIWLLFITCTQMRRAFDSLVVSFTGWENGVPRIKHVVMPCKERTWMNPNNSGNTFVQRSIVDQSQVNTPLLYEYRTSETEALIRITKPWLNTSRRVILPMQQVKSPCSHKHKQKNCTLLYTRKRCSLLQ